MREKLKFTILFAAIVLTFSTRPRCQEVSQFRGPGVNANGINIADIADAPFSATVVIELERYWPDGSSQIRRTINLIGRDSTGRTHNETRTLMPEYFHGSPALVSVRLFDPMTRIRTTYDPALKVARQEFVQKSNEEASPPNPAVRTENLGTSALNGLQARGTRRTITIPAKQSGTGDPVEVVDESWYSEDLQITLLVHRSDPRVGELTVGVSGLKREEPPVSMFEVPKGYKFLGFPQPSPDPSPAPQPAAAGTTPNS